MLTKHSLSPILPIGCMLALSSVAVSVEVPSLSDNIRAASKALNGEMDVQEGPPPKPVRKQDSGPVSQADSANQTVKLAEAVKAKALKLKKRPAYLSEARAKNIAAFFEVPEKTLFFSVHVGSGSAIWASREPDEKGVTHVFYISDDHAARISYYLYTNSNDPRVLVKAGFSADSPVKRFTDANRKTFNLKDEKKLFKERDEFAMTKWEGMKIVNSTATIANSP